MPRKPRTVYAQPPPPPPSKAGYIVSLLLITISLLTGTCMVGAACVKWFTTDQFGLGGSLLTLTGTALIGAIIWGRIQFEIGSVKVNLEQNKESAQKILAIFGVFVVGLSFYALAMKRTSWYEDMNNADDTTTATTGREIAGMGDPQDLNPIEAQTFVDDVTIGKKIGADGMIVAEDQGDDFAPGDAIYVTMEIGDAPAGSEVKLSWYGPGETKIADESKTVILGQEYLTFELTDTSSWQKGNYRAEVWIGDEKVNQQQFQIVDAREAGK